MKKRRFSLCAWILAASLLAVTACANPHTQESEHHITTETTAIPVSTESSTPSIEDRLIALFQTESQAGLALEDVTFFGTTVAGLTLEDAATIAGQQGFSADIQTEDDLISYKASYTDRISPCVNISQFDGVDFLSLSLFHETPAGEFWTRDETDPAIWTGIRNIYTFDTLEKVLSELNYTNSKELSALLYEVFALPSEEAITILRDLHTYGFCCQTAGYSVAYATDRLNEWKFYWPYTDPQSQTNYHVSFRFLVEDDCLTALDIWIDSSSAR